MLIYGPGHGKSSWVKILDATLAAGDSIITVTFEGAEYVLQAVEIVTPSTAVPELSADGIKAELMPGGKYASLTSSKFWHELSAVAGTAPPGGIDGGTVRNALSAALPAMNAPVRLPVPNTPNYHLATHPTGPPNPEGGTGWPLELAIIQLNDQYGWTREQIADWLETLDLDLTFQTPRERAPMPQPPF